MVQFRLSEFIKQRLILVLSTNELLQYSRQLSLSEIGHHGQLALKNSKVLCIGAGGLGAPILLYLTAAGVGTLGVVDNDVVELSNLQRQVLYTHDDIGKFKAICARKRLYQLNPNVNVIPYNIRLIKNNVLNIMTNYDIIVDGTDNFLTRYLINDAAFTLNKPVVYGSILGFEGQCSVFMRDRGPCYRCLYPSISESFAENCNDAGVLGILPGLLGCIQSTEVIKLILNIGDTLIGKLLSVDALTMDMKKFNISQAPDCILCNDKKSFSEIVYDEMESCSAKLHRSITLEETRVAIEQNGSVTLLDVRSEEEHEAFNIGGICIPLSQLRNNLQRLDPMKKTVVYCSSGDISKTGASILAAAGFIEVYSLSNGIEMDTLNSIELSE
jgi:molybdopterin/thiamine biosynthesis adenylyltransferase/rhodanese-related sulfurtransferase